jgi:hypothetical protein
MTDENNLKQNNENKSQTHLQLRIHIHAVSQTCDHKKSGGRDVCCCGASWYDARQRNRKNGNAKGSAKAAELSQGSLMVYSVMDRFDDDDVVYYEYSSYAIYAINGKLFRHVENRVSSSDQIPEAVTLPAGSYVIEARSATDVYARVPVVIKPGRQTILDLRLRGKQPFSGIVRN